MRTFTNMNTTSEPNTLHAQPEILDHLQAWAHRYFNPADYSPDRAVSLIIAYLTTLSQREMESELGLGWPAVWSRVSLILPYR